MSLASAPLIRPNIEQNLTGKFARASSKVRFLAFRRRVFFFRWKLGKDDGVKTVEISGSNPEYNVPLFVR